MNRGENISIEEERAAANNSPKLLTMVDETVEKLRIDQRKGGPSKSVQE